ncbi:MAG: dihydrofolate reductase [Nannocystaceae bacterium]|nr:dihydrofolate reductase [Nannocystaceae bacterium]
MLLGRRSTLALALVLAACAPRGKVAPPDDLGGPPPTDGETASNGEASAPADDFQIQADQFADLRVLRYQIPGWETLLPKQKELVYYLYQAALSGRDIIWDQNNRHNLTVRRTLEAIVRSYDGAREGKDWDAFMTYAKRVWFSNGIHHHYSNKKIVPEFSEAYFATLVTSSDAGQLPLQTGQNAEALLTELSPVLFDPKLDAKRVVLDPKVDMIAASATNFYSGVTQREAEKFYRGKIKKGEARAVSHGLNSQLAKVNGKVVERVWKVGGMYGPAIAEIVVWLRRAQNVAENPAQALVIEKLIEFYETGSLRVFDAYSVAWVNDTESRVDFVNGFIEVYGDPLGYRGAFESVVSIRDMEASKRMSAISKEAQWFEDNSPIPADTKKANVKGITAKVITVVVESGDASPSTPIGINLPNANWIRAEHGSKSVNLGNIVHAYDESNKQSGALEEFAFDETEVKRQRAYGALADTLHTDLHEVIGHASGAIKPGVGTPKETLKSYSSTLEEGRADLVALYYLMDPKLIEIGVIPSLEVGKAAYDDYIRGGMMVQLSRLEVGDDIEEAHMRNRQMVAQWVFERGKADNVVEKVRRDNKTYFVVRDYDKLRTLFGQLLAEVQRIKSEGTTRPARRWSRPTASKSITSCTKKCWRATPLSKLRLTPASSIHDSWPWSVMDRSSM